MVPYERSNFKNVFSELEKAIEKEYEDELEGRDPHTDPDLVDPKNLAYLEGEDVPVVIPPPKRRPPVGAASRGGERVQDMNLNLGPSTRHNIQKNPAELNGAQEYYENPYGGSEGTRGGASRRGGYPDQGRKDSGRGGYYGNRKRKKRGTEYDKMFWGIHRIMSTGKWNWVVVF